MASTRDKLNATDQSASGSASPAAEAAVARMRIRFAKRGDFRFTSHRDLVRAMERLFRRADVSVRQSEGFHPKPRMMFPSALALGVVGLDEVFEVDLAEPIDSESLVERLAAQAPLGLDFLAAEPVTPGARKARAKWFAFELPLPAERVADVAAMARRLMESTTYPVARPGRAAPVDLRAALAELTIHEGMLRMKFLAKHEAQARPRDILEVLELADVAEQGRLVRTRVELES